MKSVSMLELRSRGRDIVKRLQKGEHLTLTYRGKKVATLTPEPCGKKVAITSKDPIYKFVDLAEPMGAMTNEEIDQALYGVESNLR